MPINDTATTSGLPLVPLSSECSLNTSLNPVISIMRNGVLYTLTFFALCCNAVLCELSKSCGMAIDGCNEDGESLHSERARSRILTVLVLDRVLFK